MPAVGSVQRRRGGLVPRAVSFGGRMGVRSGCDEVRSGAATARLGAPAECRFIRVLLRSAFKGVRWRCGPFEVARSGQKLGCTASRRSWRWAPRCRTMLRDQALDLLQLVVLLPQPLTPPAH